MDAVFILLWSVPNAFILLCSAYLALSLSADNYSAGEGTYFLREYMIPRGSSSICIYDTRSLSDDSSDNIAMLKNWITKGVRHGELLIRSELLTTLYLLF